MTYQDEIMDTAELKPEFFYRGGEKPIKAETISAPKISNVCRVGINNIAITLLTFLTPNQCIYTRDEKLEDDMIVVKLWFDTHSEVKLIFRVADDKTKLTEH